MARQRTPQAPQAAPPVQRLRIRYAKRDRLRFTSTRDFQRALERALRRADVPMAFSSGFHPHPRISYANAAPTGVASEAEYVELALSARVHPDLVRRALEQALPTGLDVLTVVDCADLPVGSLADSLQASDWLIRFPQLDRGVLDQALATYLALDVAEVTRMTKSGPRTFDTRAAVLSVVTDAESDPACAILRMVVRHTTPSVRPDDILTALRSTASLVEPAPPQVRRLTQGPLIADPVAVGDPFARREVTGVQG